MVTNLFYLVLNTVGSIKAGIKCVGSHAEVNVAACTNRILNGHIFARPGVNVVGNNRTAEAKLIADNTLNECFATARPNVTDSVIGGHDAYASAVLNCLFKGLEVNFAQSLLVTPSVNRVTLVLGFVKNKVLQVAVLTCVGKTANLLCKHSACQEAVLGEILVVTTAPSTAVQVCTKAVGTVHSNTLNAHFFTVVDTKAVSQGLVPGLTENGCAGEAGATLCTCVKGTYLRRTVVVGELRLTDRRNCRITKVTCVNEFYCFAKGDLAQDNIPKGMVVIGTEEQAEFGGLTVFVNQSIAAGVIYNTVVFNATCTLTPYNRLVVNGVAENVGCGVVPIACRILGVLVVLSYVVCHFSVGNVGDLIGIGECCTCNKADILTAVATVKADTVNSILTCELVGYGIAGYVVDQEIDGCGNIVGDDTLNIGSTAGEINGLDVVRVGHQLELIVTCIQFISLVAIVVEVVCIVASEVLYVNGDGKGLFFAGIDDACLGKANQVDVRFFNTAVSVFGGKINLYNILSRNATNVGNRYCNGNFAFAIDFGTFGNGKRFYRPLEGCIGKSVTERILNNTVIAGNGDDVVVFVKNFTGVLIPNSLNVSGLVPLVSQINAFDVIDERGSGSGSSTRIASGTGGVHIGSIGVVTDTCGTCALKADVACHIVGVCIGETTGRRNLTVKNGRNCACGTCTGSTYYKACIDTGNGIDKIKLHCVGGVDDNDNVLVVFANVLEHCFLFGRDLKIVAACVDCRACVNLVLHSGRVLGFTCVTADNNECSVGITLCTGQKRFAIIFGIIDFGLCKTVECVEVGVDRANVAKGSGKITIHGNQIFIIGNTVLVQRLQKINVFCRVVVLGQNLTRAGTAIYPVDNGVTEYVNVRSLVKAQRQNTVVLNQYASLFDNLFGKLLATLSCLVDSVAVNGERVEVENFLKEGLQTRNVGCHLRFKRNDVSDYESRDQNKNHDNLYDLTDFHKIPPCQSSDFCEAL